MRKRLKSEVYANTKDLDQPAKTNDQTRDFSECGQRGPWSGPSLSAYARNTPFQWRGSYEPQPEKTNVWLMRSTKTQISLRICEVSSESSLSSCPWLFKTRPEWRFWTDCAVAHVRNFGPSCFILLLGWCPTGNQGRYYSSRWRSEGLVRRGWNTGLHHTIRGRSPGNKTVTSDWGDFNEHDRIN